MEEWASIYLFIFFLPLTEFRCDEISLDRKPKPVGKIRSKYTHAQKMRASMTHIFGRDFGLGKYDWTKNQQTGRMIGNPSTSHLLGTYMLSLRNRKIHNSLISPGLDLMILFTIGSRRWCGNQCPGDYSCMSQYYILSYLEGYNLISINQGDPSKAIPLQPSHGILGFKFKTQACSNHWHWQPELRLPIEINT
jgi:hypothetical protein